MIAASGSLLRSLAVVWARHTTGEGALRDEPKQRLRRRLASGFPVWHSNALGLSSISVWTAKQFENDSLDREHLRGGSRVVQTCDLQKSLKCFQIFAFFISQVRYVQEINYPSCFIVYYKIKQRKTRRISLFR